MADDNSMGAGHWAVEVPHHPVSARLARQRLADTLPALIPMELLVDAAIVVTELVSNAVRHAEPLPGGVIHVAWCLRPAVADRSDRPERLRGTDATTASDATTGTDAITASGDEFMRVEVRVTDGGVGVVDGNDSTPLATRQAGPDEVSGRGLAIVAALAVRWGVERVGTGQCVWAELSDPRVRPGSAELEAV